ncbi:MAG: Crp/Fnr family transcriptional regulator [Pseudonocardiaceae bacterium]
MTEEIRAGSFLSALTTSEQVELRRLGGLRLLQRGDTLFHEGDPSDFVVLILRGNVKVSSVGDSGAETLLAMRGAGDIVGEMSAVDGEPRSAQVSALEHVQAQVISAREFAAFLEAHPRATKVLLALVTARLRDADHKRVEVRELDVLGRIARRLLELSKTHGRPTPKGITLDLSLSQQELADWVGASREAVAKALRLLRERGAIDTRRRAITILQPELLHRLLEPRASKTDL